jgi:uncharacterized metal-binding protein
MPSGKAHLRIELLVLCLLGALGAYLILEGWITWSTMAIFSASYVGSMLLLSPDLDLVGSRPFRRWGPLRVLWWPYAVVFRHRRLSHHWLFGPLTRVCYVLAWVVAVGIAVGWVEARDLDVTVPSATTIAAVALGLYVPNLAHIAADGLQAAWKRRQR